MSYRGRDGGGAQRQAPPDADLQRIIQRDDYEAAAALVKAAEQWGGFLKDNDLKTSQIRTIFASVRQIEMLWPVSAPDSADARSAITQLVLLKPKLAYQAGRNDEVKPLADLLTRAIDLVGEDRANFQRFMDFFEAILAYHKAKGGKD